MKQKRPWLAAFLNIIIPGLGYLYVRRRKVFGYLLTISSVMSWIWFPAEEVFPLIAHNVMLNVSMILITIAFAYDAYAEAKVANLGEKKGILRSTQNDTGRSTAELEKEKNIEKLKDFIASSSEKITNDQVEKKLGVSNATAERYLNELEKEGMIHQVGKTGVKTYYEKV